MVLNDPLQPERLRRIQELMTDIRAALAAGRSVNEHSIMAAHPELMPELGEAFRDLWRQTGARPSDAVVPAETVVRPRVRQSPTALPVEETVARPGRSMPAEAAGIPDGSVESDSTIDDSSVGGFERAVGSAAATGRLIQVPGYSVQRELSRGGQAVVFVAIHLATGRKVALKVMLEGPFADERSMARFQREVQILAALDHPNIVSIIDTGKTSDGSHFIAMPYITGVTLDEYMRRRQQKEPADPSKLLRMFYKICLAVNEAHLRGIVHRDLKPSNIRVDERGEPHVLDFGLARSALDRFIKGSNQPVSITGEFMGSLPWSSPEQAEGDPEKIDLRTDVYSLGVILYQMLTGGRFPYEVVGNIRDVLNNILTSEPKPPSQVLAGVQAQKAQAGRAMPPHSLPAVNEIMERIVLKALSKQKESRYQNAGELGKDVARYLLGKQVKKEPAPAEASTPPVIEAAAASRRTWIFVVAGVAICVALVTGAFAWTKMHKGPVPPTEITNNPDGGSTPDVPRAPSNPSPPSTLAAAPRVPSTPSSAFNGGTQTVPPVVQAVTGDWVSLFNGKDLTGWDATPTWHVVDGAILSGADINGRTTQLSVRVAGTLTTLQEYGNFHLRLKTKLSGEATVAFTAANNATAGFSISNGVSGTNPNPTAGSIWVNAVMKAAARKISILPDEWFVLDITYQGTTITTGVNNVDVATYSDPALAGLKGKIVLKKVFGGTAQWKDIQILKLE